MNLTPHIHPITGNTTGNQSYVESYLDQFLKDENRGLLKNFNHLELKNSAPPLLFPCEEELSVKDRYFSTQHKVKDPHEENFQQLSTVFKTFPLKNAEDLDDETPDCLNISHKMDKVVKDLRRHLKVMVPYFPELARLISWRHSVYLLHMLWYIRERMNPETGVAVFRSNKMAHYLAMSSRTERRLREYFVDRKVFKCTYDRQRHELNISIDWEGLNTFLLRLSPTLAIFPSKNCLKDSVVDNKDLSLPPQELTSQEEKAVRWFRDYIFKDASILNAQQILTAMEDLGTAPLLPEGLIRADFKYLLYDENYPLVPYLNASWKEMVIIFEIILKSHGHLIPAIRPLYECPSYYYKGLDMDPEVYTSWGWREKITYNFTKRIAHLIGLKNYEAVAGHMSIVEWNLEGDRPEFVIATRNGVMAMILGSFFASLMYSFKENYRFYLVPLEGDLPYLMTTCSS